MPDRRTLLHQTADLAADYLDGVDRRPVGATATREELLAALGGPLPDRGEAPGEVVANLARGADPGVIASAGPRYFGFVIGGSLPSAVAADWLTTAWDQNGFAYATSPAGSVVEEVTAGWLVDAVRPAGGLVGRVRERSDDGHVHRPRGGSPSRAPAGRLGRRGGRPDRRAADRGRPRRRGPRDRAGVAPDGSASANRTNLRVEADEQGRMRPDRLREVLAGVADRPVIVCGPVRQRQHRRVRSAAGDRRRGSRAAQRLAPRRRRVRAVGGRVAGAAPPRRRASTGRTPGRPTPTSGSTSPTTAGSRSSATPRPTTRR